MHYSLFLQWTKHTIAEPSDPDYKCIWTNTLYQMDFFLMIIFMLNNGNKLYIPSLHIVWNAEIVKITLKSGLKTMKIVSLQLIEIETPSCLLFCHHNTLYEHISFQISFLVKDSEYTLLNRHHPK